MKDIYTIFNNVYKLVLSDKVYKEKINFNSLMRQFVDETTHFSSPVILELEKLDKLL